MPRLNGGDVVVVFDGDTEKSTQVRDQFPQITDYGDYSQMLDQAGLDAVIITTPHFFHPEMAIQAIKQGNNVLVDKPVEEQTKDVAAMKNELTLKLATNERQDRKRFLRQSCVTITAP